jgi:hypothetical protein
MLWQNDGAGIGVPLDGGLGGRAASWSKSARVERRVVAPS